MSKFLSLMAALAVAFSHPAAYAGGEQCAQKEAAAKQVAKTEGGCCKDAAAKAALVSNVTEQKAEGCDKAASACSTTAKAECSKSADAKVVAVSNVEGGECPMAKAAKMVANVAKGECSMSAAECSMAKTVSSCSKGQKDVIGALMIALSGKQSECGMKAEGCSMAAAKAVAVANVSGECAMGAGSCSMANGAGECDKPCEGTKVVMTGNVEAAKAGACSMKAADGACSMADKAACSMKAGECSKSADGKTVAVSNVSGECKMGAGSCSMANGAGECDKPCEGTKVVMTGNVEAAKAGECSKGDKAACSMDKAEGCPMEAAAKAKSVSNVKDEGPGCCMSAAGKAVAAMNAQQIGETKIVLTGDSHDHGDMGGEGMGEMSPEMAAAMERWAKVSTPGQPHAEMAAMVGEWDAKTTMWMSPDAPPMESMGWAKFEMALGGRFLFQHFKGEMPGMGPFEGLGISGYDNHKAEYFNIWLDSSNTGMFLTTSKDADTSMGDMYDCMSDAPMTMKEVVKYDGGDAMEFEMWAAPAGTKDFVKTMAIHYTRKK